MADQPQQSASQQQLLDLPKVVSPQSQDPHSVYVSEPNDQAFPASRNDGKQVPQVTSRIIDHEAADSVVIDGQGTPEGKRDLPRLEQALSKM